MESSVCCLALLFVMFKADYYVPFIGHLLIAELFPFSTIFGIWFVIITI